MKKLTLILITLLVSLSTFGQTKKPTTSQLPKKTFILLYEKDKMTDKEYLICNWKLIALKTKSTGFLLKPEFVKDDSLWLYNGLTCLVAGIGGCHEDDFLIILFDDGTRVRTEMWNKFDCEGNVYLDWDKELEEVLRTKSINTIRLTNGRSFDYHEVTYTKKEDKNYFITYFNKLDEFNSKHKK